MRHPKNNYIDFQEIKFYEFNPYTSNKLSGKVVNKLNSDLIRYTYHKTGNVITMSNRRRELQYLEFKFSL